MTKKLDELLDALPQIRREYLEWISAEGRTDSKQSWALDHDIDPRTLRRWEKDPDFIAAWEQQLAENTVSPEKMQLLIDAMYAKAVKGDVKAATLYLKFTEKIMPESVTIQPSRSAKEMSDDELSAFLDDAD